ncbi:MAG TPA: hypothetical protein VLD67_04470 [Vicinamibacterales bacterium]|nr:hypothetical protein [Vicinamibacterales bacterium]
MTIKPIPACVLAVSAAAALAAQPASAPPLFRISTGDFWLNLHHYLYVLGRAESKMADAARRAVSDAPADQAKGLESLTAAERELWREAVQRYAAGPSRQDPVFDRPLIEAGNALARAGDRTSLEGVAVDSTIRATLERVAGIYRQAWWPAHHASNERWRQAIDPLIEEHGAALVGFVTRACGMPWPSDGYPVRVVAFSNWAGAFSTTGPLLVISSYDSGNTGLSALETVVHESMHQWDDPMWALLLEQAKAQRRYISRELTHAMIFFTAGEAVRSRVAGHKPYAVANGIWERGMGRFRPALDAAWLPWLRGEGSRDVALAALVKLVPEAR